MNAYKIFQDGMVNPTDATYFTLLSDVLLNGKLKPTRAKIDGKNISALSVVGRQARFDLRKGLPILTSKQIHFPSILHELIWFLRGDTNIKYLQDNNVRIWNEWADEKGDLGYGTYGSMWRRFPFNEDYEIWSDSNVNITKDFVACDNHGGAEVLGSVDQISQLIKNIEKVKKDPTASCGRRLIVSAWHPYYIDKVALPPCHVLFQFTVDGDELICHLYQRSCDLFLGVPFNITSYSILTYIIAHLTGLKPAEFIHTYHDLHIYENHLDQVNEQLTREVHLSPKLEISSELTSIDDIRYEHFNLQGYKHSGALKGKVAI